MNTFGKEFRNFALKFGKFTIWNKIAIYLERISSRMTYSEFVERTISVLEQIDQLADIAERSSTCSKKLETACMWLNMAARHVSKCIENLEK